jgi:hypothetical protein
MSVHVTENVATQLGVAGASKASSWLAAQYVRMYV